MAEPDQPKKETVRIQKETVRIQLPVPPPTKPPQPTVNPRETVRIQLPVRETGGPPQSAPEDISSTNFLPPPKPPPATGPSPASVRPPPVAPPSGPKKETERIPPATGPLPASVRPPPVAPPSGPKKETTRILLMPEPLGSAQKKTQPLVAMPNVVPQNPPIAVAPVEKSSMLLYWMLLSISALILIIEIWTYFS
jgi:hypothetical protein